jgi:DNA repair protein RadC
MRPEALSDVELAELVAEAAQGIVPARAPALLAAWELARRFGSGGDPRPLLDSPERVLGSLPGGVRSGKKEHLVGFYLNARSRLLHLETVSVGTLSASLVHPREVFAPAVAHSAAALIVVHNHPSGDCSPSAEDRDATRRLVRAGDLLGIPLLDHIVVAERGFYSFKESGLLA